MNEQVQIDSLNLRKIRKSMGKTVRELANEAGVSYSTISRVETGNQKFSLWSVAKLAKAYGVSEKTLANTSICVD